VLGDAQEPDAVPPGPDVDEHTEVPCHLQPVPALG